MVSSVRPAVGRHLLPLIKSLTFGSPLPAGFSDGLSSVYSQEGFRGLYKGSLLALVGVTNGSIQFAAYEEIKRRRSDLKRARIEGSGGTWTKDDDMLVGCENDWSLSGVRGVELTCLPAPDACSLTRSTSLRAGRAKDSRSPVPTRTRSSGPRFRCVFILSNPPYPVSADADSAHSLARLVTQNSNPTLYPDIPTTIKRTYATQGLRGFYAGLGTNALRILPGTCAFFVAYENLSYFFRTTAARRAGEDV